MLLRKRKLNRLKNYDYRQSGSYFVTICVWRGIESFGRIEDGKMILNWLGRAAEKCWLAIPEHFPNVILDEFIIMPNHIHGIIIIYGDVRNNNYCSVHSQGNAIPWQSQWARSLSSIIRGFKIGVAKECREKEIRHFRWHKSYYDRIIRGDAELRRIRAYIRNNPANWQFDRNNKANLYY